MHTKRHNSLQLEWEECRDKTIVMGILERGSARFALGIIPDR